jgi:hypothetical protein
MEWEVYAQRGPEMVVAQFKTKIAASDYARWRNEMARSFKPWRVRAITPTS